MKKFSNFGFYLPSDVARFNDVSYRRSLFQDRDGENLIAIRTRLIRQRMESASKFDIDSTGLNISLNSIESNMGFSRYDNPDFVPGN